MAANLHKWEWGMGTCLEQYVACTYISLSYKLLLIVSDNKVLYNTSILLLTQLHCPVVVVLSVGL